MTVQRDAGLGRSAGRVGIAILVGSALGYLVVIATGRLLEPADYAIFMAFWGILFGLGSALSPLEQELSRLAAVAELEDRKVGADGIRTLIVGAVVVIAVGVLLTVPPVAERLFGEYRALSWVVLIAGTAFAAQFAVRGLLVGSNLVRQYSWLIMIEAAVRPVLIAAVVVAGLSGVVPLAVAVAVGSFAWLVFAVPSRRRVDWAVPGESFGPVAKRVLVLLLGSALTASVITGFPAMVALLAPSGDEARLGALYAALAVARVPLLLFSAVQALAVPTVVRLSSTEEGRHRLRRVLTLGMIGALALAAVGALVGLVIGPDIVVLLFGAKYQVPGWAVAGLVWSSVLLAAVQLLVAVLVARTQAGRVLLVWAVVAVISALALMLWPGDAVLRAVVALAAGPTVGLLLAAIFVSRPAPADR